MLWLRKGMMKDWDCWSSHCGDITESPDSGDPRHTNQGSMPRKEKQQQDVEQLGAIILLNFSHIFNDITIECTKYKLLCAIFWRELVWNIWRIRKIKNGVLLLCSLCFLKCFIGSLCISSCKVDFLKLLRREKWNSFTHRAKGNSANNVSRVLHNEFWSMLPSFRLGSGLYHLCYLVQIT